MGRNVVPRVGAKSAPSSPPSPDLSSLGSTGGKSAPSAAPDVRPGNAPAVGDGDWQNAGIPADTQVDPVSPPKQGRDPRIKGAI